MRHTPAVWTSDAPWATVARMALAPAAPLYQGIAGIRNALYDRGLFVSATPPIPVISVGNLAVGGTGKTPIAAWMASVLKARGARPAIVMRGYGDDEPKVHALLNPDVPVFPGADRMAGVQAAAASGADVGLLDDAFQHRRISRLEDVVLVSADQWREPVRVLPAGPWRETPVALTRASLVIVTRKAVDRERAQWLLERLTPLTRTGRGAVAELALADLRNVVTGEVRALSDMRGASVLVTAGIGDPKALTAQLRAIGARVTMRQFPDHHVYDSSDIERLVHDARAFDHMICTLKDAMKLGPRWPREAPSPWYVSLRCSIETGGADLSALFDRVLAARSPQLR